MCARSGNVLYILFCAVDFCHQKRVKHRHSLLARRATPEYPVFTLINLILLAQIGTWRRVLFSLPKGAGHGHSLVTGAVFRPANQELQYYRSSEDAEISKVPFSKKKTYCNDLQKKGARHGPVIAVFTQCFQSWRYTTETESTNYETTSPDGKLVNHPTKELAVRGKLHY